MIKGLSNVRRLPRLGKIRLGVKRQKEGGKVYPVEVDHFIPPSVRSATGPERIGNIVAGMRGGP